VLKRLKSTFGKSADVLRRTQSAAAAITRRTLRLRRTLMSALSRQRSHRILSARPTAPLRNSLRRLVRRKKSLSLISYDATSRAHGASRKLFLARTVTSAIVSIKIPKLQKLPTTLRYRKWQAARPARQALLQRRLSAAAAIPLPVSSGLLKNTDTAQFVLQRKGHSAGHYAKTGRALRNRLISGEVRLRGSATTPSSSNVATYSVALRRVRRKVLQKYRARNYGFLNKVQLGATRLKLLRATLQAASALERKRLHYRELKFYHNRPRLRLPEQIMTRSRKRKAGLVTFVRDSLQHTRTTLGQVRTLLPPSSAYSSTVTKQAQLLNLTQDTLMSYARRDDLLPIF
jgi:hypothetical protein